MMGFAFAKPDRPVTYILEVGHGIRTKSEADTAAKPWKLTRPSPYLGNQVNSGVPWQTRSQKLPPCEPTSHKPYYVV